jgi:formamidopyrimidine-DNA glycosylase
LPELPEVETLRRGVEMAVLGRTVDSVVVTGERSVRRQERAEFAGRLEHRTLSRARRRGKYLLVDLDDGSVLVVHLRMSGQLLNVAAGAPLAPHTHAVIALDDASELRFVDPRTFGELFVSAALDDRCVPVELKNIGTDPLVEGVAAPLLAQRLKRRRTPLKAFLLDQREIAGIGNIYGDEICFAAKLRPDRRTDTLSRADVRRLVGAIDSVLAAAVEAGGSTLRDERYRDLFGAAGEFQVRHAVYDRAGEACQRCRGTVARQAISGRSSYFCGRCQR